MGPHRCVGAMLARMEAKIAFSRLLERMPNLRLSTDPAASSWASRLLGLRRERPAPAWRHTGITRGLRRLDVQY
jgi:cytochrome P450